MKKITILITMITITSFAFAQSVEIKDSEATPNILIQFNDEGTTGSIGIPSGSAPSDPSNKLYNEGGTLKWNGNPLATGVSSLWTLGTGDIIYYNTANVGIGTTNPISSFSVNGDGVSNATIFGEAPNTGAVTNYGGYFKAAGSTGRGVYGKSTETGDAINYGGYFEAAGWEGRGVYGKALNSGANTNYGGHFHANGSTGQGVTGRASGSSGIGVHGWATNSESVTNYGGYFWADGVSGRGVLGHGRQYNFYADGPGVDYGTASSIRWKQNIIEIDNPIEKLTEIRGVYFDWDEEHGGDHNIGCIAEEVGKVLPEIVVYEENGIDANGMDYSKLTPLLIEAVKELSREVDRLKQIIGE